MRTPLLPLVHPIRDHPNHYFLSSARLMLVMGQFYQRGQKVGFGIRSFPEQAESGRPNEAEIWFVEPTKDGLKPFSAAWFREHMQSFMDKAIDELTNENIQSLSVSPAS